MLMMTMMLVMLLLLLLVLAMMPSSIVEAGLPDVAARAVRHGAAATVASTTADSVTKR